MKRFGISILCVAALACSGWAQTTTQPQDKRSPGPAREIGGGAGDAGLGAAKGAGHIGEGAAKGAGDIVTLHPIKGTTDVVKGTAEGGKDVTVGAAKGTGKVVKGIGKVFKKIL